MSYHQGAIDWVRVAGAGKRFAFVRASAGTLTADSAYATNIEGARAAFGRSILYGERKNTGPADS